MTIRGNKRRVPAAFLTGTYVVCLDCGKELPYDLREMKIVTRHSKKAAASLVTKEAS